MSDMIERQAAISAICNACGKIDCDKMDKCEKLQLPPANSSEFPNNSDTISRQAAIDTTMETVFVEYEDDDQRKEESIILQTKAAIRDRIKALPPVYVPVINVGDMISRQDAIKAICEDGTWLERQGCTEITMAERKQRDVDIIEDLPTVHQKQTNCEYCHTDRDGYVFPLEKNSHAFIDRDKIVLKANGWRGEAKIKYCPICGRRLTDDTD